MTDSRGKHKTYSLVRVEILVWPKPGVPDPQQNDVLDRLRAQGYTLVTSASRAKYFQIKLSNITKRNARGTANAVGKRLLANPVIEQFEISKVEVLTP